MEKNNKVKRRLLISCCFDIGMTDEWCPPTVSLIHDLESDEIITKVSGVSFGDPRPFEMLENINSKQKIYRYLKYALLEVLPKYQGPKVITDIHITNHYDNMISLFGTLHVSNQSEPKDY